jgi:hypothetical protein
MPIENINSSKKQVFDMLYNWLHKEISDSIRIPIVDLIFGFITDKQQVEDVQKWLGKGAIMNKDGEKELAKINASHKRTILVNLSKSTLLTNEEKKNLRTQVLGGDESDIAKNTLLTCHAAIPDAQNKEQVWKDLTDPKSTLSSE